MPGEVNGLGVLAAALHPDINCGRYTRKTARVVRFGNGAVSVEEVEGSSPNNCGIMSIMKMLKFALFTVLRFMFLPL